MLYYRFKKSITTEYGIETNPMNLDHISFLAGRIISSEVPLPMKFILNHPKDKSPRHLLGNIIPVASKLFLDNLTAAGVDNFQKFPAVLFQPSTGKEYSNYFAFNIIGLIDAVDNKSSEYDEILPGDKDTIPALVDFKKLIFLKSKVMNLPMFRLLQSPVDMFLIDHVMEYLRAHKPEDGWGLTTYEVPVQ